MCKTIKQFCLTRSWLHVNYLFYSFQKFWREIWNGSKIVRVIGFQWTSWAKRTLRKMGKFSHSNVGKTGKIKKIIITWEQRAASSWKVPPTNMQCSGVVILHWPRIPMQHGWPITSQTICSAAWPWPLCSKVSTSIFRQQIGHFVMSSGQMYGATEAGDSQNLIKQKEN